MLVQTARRRRKQWYCRTSAAAMRLLLLAIGVSAASVAQAQTLPPPGYDPITLQPTYGLGGPAECNPASYEVLPAHRARLQELFRGGPRRALAGVYGRLEYLNISLDEPKPLIGRTLDDFDARDSLGVFFNDQPALPLLQATVADQLIVDSAPFTRGEPFLIDNPRRGRFFRDPLTGAFTPVAGSTTDLSEPLLAEVYDVPTGFGEPEGNGIRGMIGRPWAFGLIEADVWGAAQSSDRETFDFLINPLRGNGIDGRRDTDVTDDLDAAGESIIPTDLNVRQLVGIPVLFTDPILEETDPAVIALLPANNAVDAPRQGLFVSDESFTSEYTSELGGAGLDVMWHLKPDDGWRLMALTGFRYTRLDEEFAATGVASAGLNAALGGPADIRTGQLTSSVENNLYMGTFGVRSEWTLGWLSLGFQPRVGLGGTSQSATVFSSGLAPNSPTVRTSVNEGDFTATFDLSTYARLQLREWFSVQIGYEYSVLRGVYRPDSVLNYSTVSTAPAITADNNDEDYTFDRLFVGFEVLLP